MVNVVIYLENNLREKHMYENESAVPARWRSLDAYKMTLEQINNLITAAQARTDAGELWADALYDEREKFRANHQAVNGQWLANKKGAK